MASPDLSGAKRKVESFMTETADLYLPAAVHSKTLDANLKLLPVESGTPWLPGLACKLKDQTSTARGSATSTEGGNQLLVVVTKVDFSLDDIPDEGIPEGTLIICRSSLRMPQLVGAVYVVRQPVLKTFGIQYSVLADRRKSVDP